MVYCDIEKYQTDLKEWFSKQVLEYDFPMWGTLTYPYNNISDKRIESDLYLLKNRLSKTIFRNAYSRHGKNINWIHVIEGSKYNRHVHLIFDCKYPEKLNKIFYSSEGKFRLKQKFWKYINEFSEFDNNKKAVDYICKKFSKIGSYADSFKYQLM